MWPFNLSVRLPIVDLVGRYLTNYLIGRELTPNRFAPFTSAPCDTVVSCGISTCFQVLSPCLGQIAHALLTRPPLDYNLPGRSPSNHIPVRLACVKHAASVRPEPGSNSDVQSFSTPFRSRSLSPSARQSLRLPLRSLPFVAFLSQNSDCRHPPSTLPVPGSPHLSRMSFSLFSVSFSRFVPSSRAAHRASLADSLISIANRLLFVKHSLYEFTVV